MIKWSEIAIGHANIVDKSENWWDESKWKAFEKRSGGRETGHIGSAYRSSNFLLTKISDLKYSFDLNGKIRAFFGRIRAFSWVHVIRCYNQLKQMQKCEKHSKNSVEIIFFFHVQNGTDACIASFPWSLKPSFPWSLKLNVKPSVKHSTQRYVSDVLCKSSKYFVCFEYFLECTYCEHEEHDAWFGQKAFF